MLKHIPDIQRALAAVGELLAAEGQTAAVVIVGGDLIFLKLYAAADDVGPKSVHFQDLLALNPTPEELDSAAGWVRAQDPSPEFGTTLDKVLRHARAR